MCEVSECRNGCQLVSSLSSFSLFNPGNAEMLCYSRLFIQVLGIGTQVIMSGQQELYQLRHLPLLYFCFKISVLLFLSCHHLYFQILILVLFRAQLLATCHLVVQLFSVSLLKVLSKLSFGTLQHSYHSLLGLSLPTLGMRRLVGKHLVLESGYSCSVVKEVGSVTSRKSWNYERSLRWRFSMLCLFLSVVSEVMSTARIWKRKQW